MFGLTTPEKRTNSLPWLISICFSPLTTRLPFGSTSVTVTVIVPLNVFAALAPPVDANLLPPVADRFTLLNRPPRKPAAGTSKLVLPARLAFAPDDFVALMFSAITIVRMSPMLRGR